MKTKIIALAFLFFLFTHAAHSQHPVFRWDIKTLTDNSNIDWLQEVEKTKHKRYANIEALSTAPIAYNSCHDVGTNTRRADEKRVVKLKVRIVGVKKETNDNDYHIVMQSLTNSANEMVAEIPDPNDIEYSGSQFAALRNVFTQERQQIETLLGDNVTTKMKSFPANTLVKIYGVPFYDCKHPGEVSGASANFRELHPVLLIEEM